MLEALTLTLPLTLTLALALALTLTQTLTLTLTLKAPKHGGAFSGGSVSGTCSSAQISTAAGSMLRT